MHGGHTTRHSRAQLVFACTAGTPHATLALSWFMHAVAFLHARRAHHTPLSRSVGSCMHGGHTTRHSRAQLVLACTAGTPHATLALSWFLHAVAFLHARRAHHTPPSPSVGSCKHRGHTTRHSRAQLVHACSCLFACTAGTPHATLRSVVFCMQLLFCMQRGHTTPHVRAQLVHACTAGTPHATLALSWFMHAVGFCMHGGHTTRHSRAQLVLTSMHGGHTTRNSRAQLVHARTGGTPHATLALSWFLRARRAIHTPLSR